MPVSRPGTAANKALFGALAHVVTYARRWAVSRSPSPEDAIVFDACMRALGAVFGKHAFEEPGTPTARHDRFVRDGDETITGSYTLPITVEDAAATLHRLARRYTNGRGTTTAEAVNQTARCLIELGISLDETQRLDGTIWAADGDDGKYDGLTPEQRAEALASLDRPAAQPTDT